MEKTNKILVAGVGAIGGIFAFKLVKSGYNCDLITNNDVITRTITENGITLESQSGVDIVKAKPQTNLPNVGQYDYIFLMMKTNSVRDSCKAINDKKLLKENGLIITVQNGDVYEQVTEFFPNKIVTCIIAWGSTMLAPGKYRITSPGKTFIGDRNNKLDLIPIRDLISQISPTPVEITTNILGIIWAKLCVNCAINAISGISGLSIGEFTKYESGRKLFLAVYSETLDVAVAQNIKLEKLVTNPYLMYLPKKSNFIKRFFKTIVIKQAGKKFGLVKPSMLQDIERGRKTEIEFLNGFVSNKGKILNFPTPVNDNLTQLIQKIESGSLKPNPENLSIIDIN